MVAIIYKTVTTALYALWYYNSRLCISKCISDAESNGIRTINIS